MNISYILSKQVSYIKIQPTYNCQKWGMSYKAPNTFHSIMVGFIQYAVTIRLTIRITPDVQNESCQAIIEQLLFRAGV